MSQGIKNQGAFSGACRGKTQVRNAITDVAAFVCLAILVMACSANASDVAVLGSVNTSREDFELPDFDEGQLPEGFDTAYDWLKCALNFKRCIYRNDPGACVDCVTECGNVVFNFLCDVDWAQAPIVACIPTAIGVSGLSMAARCCSRVSAFCPLCGETHERRLEDIGQCLADGELTWGPSTAQFWYDWYQPRTGTSTSCTGWVDICRGDVA